ncbi:(2Fe-2S)-binding protein [Paractinoplanes atraurantiacus]|uniref:FhuF 2Fe-2S C-terminal domain-containing protein n=1 Tax=Paractinoplanes atraurantiacus TaxID=1036182 RepID=A0A285J2N2_9ACTN|nr:(2Fe-2S)-binding protein [Actinoplanes atraurantiacus]SNY54580.1 FhuF 2Fe-2S C-terminal domain-containing protein [Actinoplanes atraurantiacus]
MPEVDATPALSAAARFGPYFVWEPYDGGNSWRPYTDLVKPEVVAERVEVARGVLVRMSGLRRDDIEERVVASITFLGLASRLLSPVLGAAVAGGAVPVPDPAKLWWRPVEGGPIPFAQRGLTAVEGAGALTLALVEPVLEVFRRRFALSPKVLWGNVASALGGAAAMTGRPESAAIVGETLGLPQLRGMATWDGRRLVRRNCCLYYRIPGGGTCGDCVLRGGSRRGTSSGAL